MTQWAISGEQSQRYLLLDGCHVPKGVGHRCCVYGTLSLMKVCRVELIYKDMPCAGDYVRRWAARTHTLRVSDISLASEHHSPTRERPPDRPEEQPNFSPQLLLTVPPNPREYSHI